MSTPTGRTLDPERTNREFWDADADDYQAAHGEQLATSATWGAYSIPESELGVLGNLTGLDVLELGCGGAQASLAVARAARRVTGLDQSRAQLGHASHNVAAAGMRMPLVCATGTSTPFRDAAFDVVFCDHGAMSFCDPYATVPEVARLLRPGGLLAFSISSLLHLLCFPPGDPDGRVTRRLQRPLFGAHWFDWGDGTIDVQLPHGRWIELFRAHGFEIEALLELQPPEDAVTTYEGFTDLAWARRWPAEEIWKVRKR